MESIKEYIKFEQYHYVEDNDNKNISSTKLYTEYNLDSLKYELKLSIVYDMHGHSVNNYIMIDMDDIDELIHALVLFKHDAKNKKFERDNDKSMQHI